MRLSPDTLLQLTPGVRTRLDAAGHVLVANYDLAVVLFAVSLFFAGISTKLGSRRFKTIVLVCGWVIFLGTVVWVATTPVSVAV